ncbi:MULTISPECIES: hypothetical protein [Pseudomonas]|uniref:hypothetical protein n=1 Tax=Pseudomonas TaxID=286 RepID=UPI00274F120D|nr:hypothetical protein [Pseudomonas protegens]MDP9506853.1 hypothetical protein [Pseudomonas protegens]MDP9514632.1 hypothetical protein [Pseudomonas protegens]
MPEIKERPILFSAPMVPAILEGRRTVTRCTVKPQPEVREVDIIGPMLTFKNKRGGHWLYPNAKAQIIADCAYGQPGDRLWVRESLGYDCEYGHYFAAGGKHGETVYLCSLFDDEDAQTGPSYDGLLPERSVPSIRLHRRYSRILLETTDVRVERLQVISRSDIRAEGLECPPELASDDVSPNYRDWYPMAFRALWESTGGDWDANPWVWVVEFRRVQP